MPNWCSNVAQISHSDKFEIDKIENELSNEESSELFNTLLTRPLSEEDNWYGWNVENWGTKWDATICYWERLDENTLMVEFDTAWSPPVNLYDTLTEKMGYQINAQYFEPGMGFVGEYIDGNDSYYEYDVSDKESWSDIPEDLIDFAGIEHDHESYLEHYGDEDEDSESDKEG